MIKLHGAPKPHAVSARPCRGLGPALSDAGTGAAPEGRPCGLPCEVFGPGRGGGGLRQPHPDSGPAPSARTPLLCSVPPVPSASCPERSCSCTRRSSTAGRSCSCARSVGTGPRAAMACKCTSKPSTGGGWPIFPWAWPSSRPARGPRSLFADTRNRLFSTRSVAPAGASEG